MASIETYLAASEEERIGFVKQLLFEDQIPVLVKELNEHSGAAGVLGRALIEADLDPALGLHPDLGLVVNGLDLAPGVRDDLKSISDNLELHLDGDPYLGIDPKQLAGFEDAFRSNFAFVALIAYGMDKAAKASPVTLMAGKAEGLHRALVNVAEHPDLARHLEEALRQLDVADAFVKDIARSNAATLETFASLLPLLIETANGTVAAGEPPAAAESSRRGFLAACAGIAATGVVTYGITKHSTDRQIESSSEDAQKTVDAIEAAEAQEATIEHLAAALERALTALESACEPGQSRS